MYLFNLSVAIFSINLLTYLQSASDYYKSVSAIVPSSLATVAIKGSEVSLSLPRTPASYDVTRPSADQTYFGASGDYEIV